MKNQEEKRQFLIDARHKKGLSQIKLGELVGVSGNAITQYEQGTRFPIPDVLIKLCEVLEIEVKQFYEKKL